MENNFFLNEAPIPPPSSSSSSSMPTWHSLSSSPMDHLDSFFNLHHHHQQFDSALSSLVSSPAPSNSNLNIPNPPHPPLMKSMALNSSVAEFSADPGFAERAAKFSCFGSRSFNGRRTTQTQTQRSDAPLMMMMMENGGKIHRVSSSPSLKALGLGFGSQSQMENKNSNNYSPLDSQEDESTISDQNPNGEISGVNVKPSPPDVNSRKRKVSSSSKAPKPKESSTSSIIPPLKGGEANEDSNAKRRKPNDEGHENVKGEEESKGGNGNNDSKAPEAPKDYIHVRARRGQATDSHSLAERVRREKISERMKLLQDLVPGCNKVTGKALMLDEIINYVQSLQRQVEFLSMKLASVNTRLDLSMENLITKDIFESNNNSMGQQGTAIFPSDSSAQAFYGQNPAIHSNNIPNGTVTQCSVESLDIALFGLQLPPLNAFNEVSSQYPMTFSEDDLHTIVQMGFGQTENRRTPTQSPVFNGSNQLSHMKVEL